MIINPNPHYWKIKSAVLETDMARWRAEAAINEALIKQAQVIAAAGLDPNMNYNLDDATETIQIADK